MKRSSPLEPVSRRTLIVFFLTNSFLLASFVDHWAFLRLWFFGGNVQVGIRTFRDTFSDGVFWFLWILSLFFGYLVGARAFFFTDTQIRRLNFTKVGYLLNTIFPKIDLLASSTGHAHDGSSLAVCCGSRETDTTSTVEAAAKGHWRHRRQWWQRKQQDDNDGNSQKQRLRCVLGISL